MNCYNISLVLLLLVSCQMQGPEPVSKEGSLVELKPVSAVELKKGTRHELPLIFEIEPGYHIMADTGSTDRWVYTQMTLEAEQGFLTDTPLFPSPADLFLADDTNPLYIFEDKLEVKVPILPSLMAESGSYNLRGQLLYQACTDKKCFFPRELDFEVPLQFGDRP